MILEDILAGLSYSQIMRKQGVSKSVVSMQAAILYKQHRVKGPAALRELLGTNAGKSEIRMSRSGAGASAGQFETNPNDRTGESEKSEPRARGAEVRAAA